MITVVNLIFKNTLVLLADWANGIFAILLAAALTDTTLLWWHVIIGVLLAMSPDLDTVPELWQKGKLAAYGEHTFDHREGLHYPLPFFVVGILLALTLGYWGYVFLFAAIFHFVNDFYGTGWGIKLFWPVSNRQYKLLGRKINRQKFILKADGDWDNLSRKERELRSVVSWSKSELPAYIKRWGMANWIERIYLNLNFISVTEYFLFVVACALLVSHFAQ